MDSYINSAIQYARTDGRSGKGCVVAFSSGNDFTTETDVSFPANVNGVLTVGAVYRDGMITSYSQRGTSMDLVAFGGDNDIVTTDRMGDLGYNPNPDSAITDLSDTNFTKFFGGTSAACPQVAGVAALILSVNPNLTEYDVKKILHATAHDFGTTGWDSTYGYGLVDAFAAVKACYNISGVSRFCNQTSYTLIGNLKTNVSIQWRTNNSDISIVSGQGTDTVTLQNNNVDGFFNLYADLYVSGIFVATVSKSNIVAGTPGLGLDVIPVHKVGTDVVNGWQRNSSNNGFYVDNFSDGAFTHLEAVLTNISGNTPVQVASYTNLTPNSTFVAIPYNCNTTARFYELKVRGVNDCGVSGWQNVIIDLDHPGGPDFPLMASQQ